MEWLEEYLIYKAINMLESFLKALDWIKVTFTALCELIKEIS